VGRRCRGPNLRPRAVAGIEQFPGFQPGYGILIQLQPLGLAYGGSVPVESEGTEIRELCLLYPRPYPRAVQVLRPKEKLRPRRAREQPRQKRCSQVSEMEWTRRARREASIGVRDAGLAVYLALSRLTSQSEPESTCLLYSRSETCAQ
jgi:hypothetical protein